MHNKIIFLFFIILSLYHSAWSMQPVEKYRDDARLLLYPPHELPHTHGIKSALMHPQGHTLFTVDIEGTMHTWDFSENYVSYAQFLKSRVLFEPIKSGNRYGQLQKLICNPQATVIVQLFEKRAIIKNSNDGTEVCIKAQKPFTFKNAFLNEDGRDVVLHSGYDTCNYQKQSLDHYDIATQQKLYAYTRASKNRTGLYQADRHPNGLLLLMARGSHLIEFDKTLRIMSGYDMGNTISKIAFYPEGACVAIGCQNGSVHIFAVSQDGSKLTTQTDIWQGDHAPIVDIQFNAIGDQIYIAQPECFHVAKMQETAQGWASIHALTYDSHCLVKALAVHPTDDTFVVLGENGDKYGTDTNYYAVVWKNFYNKLTPAQKLLIQQLELLHSNRELLSDQIDLTKMQHIFLIKAHFPYDTTNEIIDIWESIPKKVLKCIIAVHKKRRAVISSADQEVTNKSGIDYEYDQG